jgi:hypothetical protein
VNKIIIALAFLSISFTAYSQSVAQLKKELETTPDIVKYVKFQLHKKYKIDTIDVVSTSSFIGTPDSLAYYGQEGKVYGPFKGKDNSYLIKILGKAPNKFYHVSHILLDTSIFQPRFADSLARSIIAKINSGASTFESMASTYSSDNATSTKGGDLGWFCLSAMLPPLSKAISAHKKGDIFKVWTQGGLHIVTINDDPKKDTGYALMLKVIL